MPSPATRLSRRSGQRPPLWYVAFLQQMWCATLLIVCSVTRCDAHPLQNGTAPGYDYFVRPECIPQSARSDSGR